MAPAGALVVSSSINPSMYFVVIFKPGKRTIVIGSKHLLPLHGIIFSHQSAEFGEI